MVRERPARAPGAGRAPASRPSDAPDHRGPAVPVRPGVQPGRPGARPVPDGAAARDTPAARVRHVPVEPGPRVPPRRAAGRVRRPPDGRQRPGTTAGRAPAATAGPTQQPGAGATRVVRRAPAARDARPAPERGGGVQRMTVRRARVVRVVRPVPARGGGVLRTIVRHGRVAGVPAAARQGVVVRARSASSGPVAAGVPAGHRSTGPPTSVVRVGRASAAGPPVAAVPGVRVLRMPGRGGAGPTSGRHAARRSASRCTPGWLPSRTSRRRRSVST